MEIVDDHFDVGVLHLVHQPQRFGSAIDNVALLLAERLDSDQKAVRLRDVACPLKEGFDLVPGLLAGAALRDVPRAGASPDYEACSKLPAAVERRIEIGCDRVQVSIRAHNAHGPNQAVKATAAKL